MSNKVKFKCTDMEQKSFDDIKRAVAYDNLLAYTDLNKTFDIRMDASNYQLETVIIQGGKPFAFYSRKLKVPQTIYTVKEKELHSIVANLKQSCKILLGQQLKVFTDHKNLTYKYFNTDRKLWWRLIIYALRKIGRASKSVNS